MQFEILMNLYNAPDGYRMAGPGRSPHRLAQRAELSGRADGESRAPHARAARLRRARCGRAHHREGRDAAPEGRARASRPGCARRFSVGWTSDELDTLTELLSRVANALRDENHEEHRVDS
ncbi:MAG: hypothetical protein WDM88_00315 [Galbitalea sp.]